jgi:hypothetical protein
VNNRRFGVLGVTVVALLAVGLAGCGRSGGSDQLGSGASPPSGPALAAGGSPGPSKIPATTATTVTFPTDAATYTKVAVAAWAAGDVSTLDQYEDSGGELHTLLACNGCYNTAFTLNGCSGAAGSTYCLFINVVGDELRLRVSNPLLGQPRAMGAGSTFSPITFPSDDSAYAQEALDAWLAVNDPRLGLLTAKPFTSAQVTALGAAHTEDWTANGTQGAAGTIYVQFRNTAGHTLAFGFLNGPPAPTTGPGSQHRITTIVYLP